MRNTTAPDKPVRIKLAGGKTMHGVACGDLKRPVVLMVHGLTGNCQEHIFYNGAHFLARHGFSSLRINLYADSENGSTRTLARCTLKTHARDVDRALKYLRAQGTKTVVALGHSYGAPSVMLADQRLIDGYVLWDPSYKPDFFKLFGAKRINKKLLKINWGYEFLVGQAMVDCSNELDWDRMAGKIQKPLLAAYAGNGILKKSSARYANLAQGPSDLVSIAGATHCFDETGAENELFHQTLVWLKKNI